MSFFATHALYAFTTSHFTSITRQQIYVLTSQHIAYSYAFALQHVFPDLRTFLFWICIMCQEIPTPRIKLIRRPFSLSSPIPHGIFIFDLYIVTSFPYCHPHSYSLMYILLGLAFSSFLPWYHGQHIFFFSYGFRLGFLNRYTYRHHCIYAFQDLNIRSSELSIFFNLFLFFHIPWLHLVALSWPAVYPTAPTSICSTLSVSHLFLQLHF